MKFDRHENLEPYSLIILKSSDVQHKAFKPDYWRSSIDFIRVFNDLDMCVNHIQAIKDELVFLIVDADLSIKTIERTCGLRQVYKIYVFSRQNKSPIEQSSHMPIEPSKGTSIIQSTKVSDMYSDLNELHQDLSNNVRLIVRNVDLVSAVIDPHSQPQEFTFNITFKSSSRAFPELLDLLRKQIPNENNKQVLIEKCRSYYADNPSTLRMIEEFEQTYDNQKAIWWYTRHSFLFILLNRSLRQQNIELIIYLHFFLFDLHQQLAATYVGTNPRTKIEKYFRGQTIALKEIEKLKETAARFGSITLNSFLSTTTDYQVALIFAGAGNYEKDNEIQSVVFIIELLPSLSNPMDHEYADVTHLSAHPSEQETLFTMGAVLYINLIEYNETEKTWFITLTNWTLESGSGSYSYNNNDISQEEHNSNDMQFIYVGRLLAERVVGYNIFDIYNDACKNNPPVTEESFRVVKTTYYDLLLQNCVINSFVYNIAIGSLAFMSGQIDIALEYLLKAQTIENETHANNSKKILFLLYHTFGHIYREKYEYSLSLHYYKTCTEFDRQKTCLQDQAAIYKILGNYEHALALLPFCHYVARAFDHRKDFMTNMNEWKSFVDYASQDKNYVAENYYLIIREYEKIGELFAGLSSKTFTHSYGSYHLKACDLPDSFYHIPINSTNLRIALDCFQRIIDICNELDHEDHSSSVNSANQNIVLIKMQLPEHIILD